MPGSSSAITIGSNLARSSRSTSFKTTRSSPPGRHDVRHARGRALARLPLLGRLRLFAFVDRPEVDGRLRDGDAMFPGGGERNVLHDLHPEVGASTEREPELLLDVRRDRVVEAGSGHDLQRRRAVRALVDLKPLDRKILEQVGEELPRDDTPAFAHDHIEYAPLDRGEEREPAPAGAGPGLGDRDVLVAVPEERHGSVVQIADEHLAGEADRRGFAAAIKLEEHALGVHVEPFVLRAVRAEEHHLAAAVTIEDRRAERLLDHLALVVEQPLPRRDHASGRRDLQTSLERRAS
jgi:hypothetical protein